MTIISFDRLEKKGFTIIFSLVIIILSVISFILFQKKHMQELLQYQNSIKNKELEISGLKNSMTSLAINENILHFDSLLVYQFDENQKKSNRTIMPCNYKDAVFIYISEYTCSACLTIIFSAIVEYKKREVVPIYLLYKTSNFRLIKVASNQSNIPIENVSSITDISFLNKEVCDVDTPRMIIVKNGHVKNSIVFMKNFTGLFSRVLKKL